MLEGVILDGRVPSEFSQSVKSDTLRDSGQPVLTTGKTGSGESKSQSARAASETTSTRMQLVDEASKEQETQELDLPGGSSLQDAEEALNDFIIDAQNRVIQFSKDEDTGKTIIRILDRETGEVVRQVPPDEFLKLVKNINEVAEELLKGLPKFI